MKREDWIWSAVIFGVVAFCMWQVYVGTLYRSW